MQNLTRWIPVAGLLAAVGAAHAQTITSRLSDTTYNSVYGGGGDVFTPTDHVTSTAITATSSQSLTFSDSKSGHILGDPNRPWAASVNAATSHTYAIDNVSNFTTISASGRSLFEASASGEGLANIFGSSSLEFEFSLGSTVNAHLFGLTRLNPDGQNLNVEVGLRKFDGFAWQIVFTTLFLPGQEGAFDQNLTLGPGQYRMSAYSAANAFHGVRPMQDNDWNYTLTTVPEPASMAALALGLGVLARRRRSAR